MGQYAKVIVTSNIISVKETTCGLEPKW